LPRRRSARDVVSDARGIGYEFPDGVARDLSVEYRLNRAAVAALDTDDGRLLLAWMASLAEPAQGAPGSASDAELRECHGRRQLLNAILKRIDYGRNGIPGPRSTGPDTSSASG